MGEPRGGSHDKSGPRRTFEGPDKCLADRASRPNGHVEGETDVCSPDSGLAG